MQEPKDQPKPRKTGQPDKGLAEQNRPVPSQAEGDRETIEEDLEQKTGDKK